MKKVQCVAFTIASIFLLAGCGGSGESSGSVTQPSPTPSPRPTPSASPTPSATCSLRARQDWVAQQLNEWYLFPETLPVSVDPAQYYTLDSYVDRMTATARAQGRDRYFTYVTSIAEENAYYSSGDSAGFGIRLALDSSSSRLYVSELFENSSAATAGLERGTEIVSIGTALDTMRAVNMIISSSGTAGLVNALGPDTAGTARFMQVRGPDNVLRTVSVTKTNFVLQPVSSRLGVRIIEDGGRKIGYVNLRTFITTATQPLREAFAEFREEGITEFIVDLRYNGGGLVSIAELLTNLLGGQRSTSDVMYRMRFRDSKSNESVTEYFWPQPQSVSPVKIAFIGTGGTASASESTINALLPYMGNNVALIGANTYGKPVGQIAVDRSACDDRLRILAFSIDNSANQGAYFNGLAPTMQRTCRAADDLGYDMGDPQESSTKSALDFLAGRSCTAIASVGARQTLGPAQDLLLVQPDRPNVMQRETPGAF